MFRNQTLATVAEAVRIKYVVGPTIPWYQEFLRYYFLTVEDSVDGSLTRRFAVLVLLLCLFGLIMVLLRRGQGARCRQRTGWRLAGATAIGLLLLTFTPTKWAVQFGAFAGLAGALGGVTAFAFARVGMHSRRNLALYVTALLFVLAWATSGLNGWFYVGNYGVPWFDQQPVIAGIPVTTIFLVLAIASGLLAGWLHFRMDYAGHTEVADTGRNRALASTPLLIVATIMVVLELGSMLKATAGRYPVYTTGAANLAALRCQERSVPRAAMLRFCVSGARRGGGVGGIPVHNAAMAVLAGRRDVTANEASAVSYAPRSGAGDDRLDIRRRRQSRTGASQSAFLMSCASVMGAVGAGAADEPVDVRRAVEGVDRVVAGVGDEDVVAGAAGQAVVTATAVEQVGVRVAGSACRRRCRPDPLDIGADVVALTAGAVVGAVIRSRPSPPPSATRTRPDRCPRRPPARQRRGRPPACRCPRPASASLPPPP